MSFRNTIDPTVGKQRQNAGKSYQESVPIITTDNSISPVKMFRKNAGKVYTAESTQQIIEIAKPQLMRVGGKQRSSGSGGAIADIKTTLQNKCLIGWTGNSSDSDIGIIGSSVAGTVQSSVKKVGSNAFSYSGGDNSFIETRLNKTLKKAKIYSISCWCRWNSFNYAGPWGMWGGVVPNWDQRPGIHTNCGNTGSSPSRLNMTVWDGVSGNPNGTSTGTSTYLNINTWYHCVFEINNTYLKIYLNGVLEGTSGTFSSSLDLWSTAQVFRLAGYELNNPVVQLNGYLDEFYILSGALSQTEIDWLYNSGNGNTLL